MYAVADNTASVIEKGDMSSGFTSAMTGVPLADRSVIALGPNYDKGPNHALNRNTWRAVNFRNILETGETATDENVCLPGGQRIDWSADDAYTRAVDQITETAAQRILDDPATKALLEKDNWTMEDRVAWEQRTSQIVSDEMDKIPGLGEYRIAQDNIPITTLPGDPKPPLPVDDPLVDSMTADRRATEVNSLSMDIANNTGIVEFDCETMAITEGSVLQRIEDRFLPDGAVIEGSFKQSSSYFYAGGISADIVSLGDENTIIDPGGHAYIVSSATGNIIEATADPSKPGISYKSLQSGYDFEDFVSGRLAVADDRVYATAATPEILEQGQEDLNNIPYETHLETLGYESDRLLDKIEELKDAPEAETLRSFDALQKIRPLSPDEMSTALDTYTRSAVADDFRMVEDMSFNYKSSLASLYDGAVGDPEKMAKLSDFLQDESQKFAGLDSQTPYSVSAFNNHLNVPYSEAMVVGEIDALSDQVSQDLAPAAPEVSVAEQSNQSPILDIKF